MIKNKMESRIAKIDIFIPAIAFTLMVIAKILFTIGNREIPIVADEYTYAFYGKQLSEFHSYRGYQYPLFYPLILAQAYWFGKADVFLAMKIINVFWSSMTVVLTYMIARKFMNWKKSLIPMLFSMIIPFQFTYSMMLMSENVYFPLLLLAIWMIVRDDKREMLSSVLYGFLVGILFLTRFVTLVMIPVFILAWLMKKIDQKTPFIRIAVQGVALSIAGIIAYMPFFAVQLKKGYPVKFLLGFSIASKTNPEQLTTDRFIMVSILYFCFMVIAASPVITQMVKSFFAIEFKNIFGRFNRLWIMAWGLFGASFVAVVRHSWRASYNYPDFERIKGRYLIFFPLIFAILATIIMFEKKTRIKNNVLNVVVCYLLPAVTFIFSYMVIAKGFLFNFGGDTLLSSIEAIDGYKATKRGTYFLVAVLVLNFLVQLISDYGNIIYKKVGIKTKNKVNKCVAVSLAVCLLCCGMAGNSSLWKEITNQKEILNQTKVTFVNEMDKIVENLDTTHLDRVVIYADSKIFNVFLTKYMKFKYDEKVIVTNEYEKFDDEQQYVFTTKPDKFKDVTIKEMGSFHYKDSKNNSNYYILLVDRTKEIHLDN